jgi:NitT/TauT family transport system permease protein
MSAAAPTRRPNARRLFDRVTQSRWRYRALIFVILAVVWQGAASAAGRLLIPTFIKTMQALAELAVDPRLWSALFVSNQAMVIGYGLSLAIGIPIGLAMGRFGGFEKATEGLLRILLVLPAAAFIPLVVTVFGLELAARVVVIALFGTIIIVVTCRAGVRQVDPSLVEMARCFGASERRIWWRVLIPGTLPAILVGARLGLATAIEGMVVVELLLAAVGVGGLILVFEDGFAADYLYAVVIVIIGESLALSLLARQLERRLAPWALRGGLRPSASSR